MKSPTLAESIRIAASHWRTLLSQDVLASTALPTDTESNTALQHGAQVEHNLALVTEQIRLMLKKKSKEFATTFTSVIVLAEVRHQAEEASTVQYRLAEKAGKLADILDRSIEEYATTATFRDQETLSIKQLVSNLSTDIRYRLLLVEQGYEQLKEEETES